MYTPEAFSMHDAATLRDFMREYPFATLVTATPEGPQVSHLPLEWSAGADGAPDRLLGHFARGNPHWRHFDASPPSLAIFHGPHDYISPTWYESDSLVPTWNYAAVHATGQPKLIDDPAETRAVLDQLVDRFERDQPNPWVNRLEPTFLTRLQEAIVAFSLPIERLEGKFKLGQNRTEEDQQASLAGLTEASGDAPGSLAAFTRDALERGGR